MFCVKNRNFSIFLNYFSYLCHNLNAIEWPTLNVDLEIDSLKHPERYPLIMKRDEMEIL